MRTTAGSNRKHSVEETAVMSRDVAHESEEAGEPAPVSASQPSTIALGETRIKPEHSVDPERMDVVHNSEMVKKRTAMIMTAALVSTALIVTGCVVAVHFASPTLGTAKAEYLAQRVLLAPTPAQVATLSSAPSAADAVDQLFASASASDANAYQAGLVSFAATANTYKTPTAFSDARYAYALSHDPNQAQLKLYYLLENIFSVDGQDKDEGITYSDVDSLHKILSDNATGSYLTLLEKVQTNYALDRYLDLTQSRAASPNENFARELMQLFMMGAYTPTDTANAHPNYSEADVSSLAYILTGYTATKDHQVAFEPALHYTGTKNFLGSSFNDPASAIQYIAAQRSPQIALFLASKLMHYYLSDTPSSADLNSFASEILLNKFQILPSVKWLLSSDIMFRPDYMQADRYKTPLEAVASLYSGLYGRNDFSAVPDSALLSSMNFTPYLPGSVFGRDGFNSNPLFYSGTIVENWVHTTYSLLHPATAAPLPPALDAARKSAHSATEFVSSLSQALYLGKQLPAATQKILVDYLGTDMTDQHVRDVTALLLDQPEFLTQSGNLGQTAIQQSNEIATGPDSKLVVVRLRGGMDYQQLVANTADPAYATDRKSLALTPADSTALGNGYVLNNVAAPLLPIVKSGQLSFINAVGLPGQIRAHDIASRQMETGLASNGILANLQQHDPSRTLVSISATPPIMMSGTSSLQIGTRNVGLFPSRQGSTAPTPLETTFSSILKSRTFPTVLSQYYGQALFLDGLANNAAAAPKSGTPAAGSKADGGKAGTSTAQEFSTLAGLVKSNVGNTYYVSADGSYDDHVTEAARFDPLATDLFANLAQFYTQESAKTKITVVVFSEFGRTDVVNGSTGTDHGVAGGILVLSNAMKLPTMLGAMNPSTDINDWTTTQIDERDVWSTIFNDLYAVPQDTLFGRSTTLATAPVTIP